MWMARVQTLVRRPRFSMVVVLRQTNCMEERVMPRAKRPKRPPLESISDILRSRGSDQPTRLV